MNNVLLISLFTLFCCIVLIIILIRKLNKTQKTLEKTVIDKHAVEVLRKDELKEYFEEEWNQEKDRLDYKRKAYEAEIQTNQIQLENQYKLDASRYDGEIKKLEIQLKEKEKRYNEVNQDLEVYRQAKIEEINTSAELYFKNKNNIIEQSINNYRDLKMVQANNELEQKQQFAEELKSQIDLIKIELEEERTKRAAINEEIRRQREVEEQQDFYRIQFSDEDKNDVEILRNVAPRLRHPEAINKVIWNAYYQKSLAELRKRAGIESSGIYKITRIKTNEIYIGQAVNISTRWADHVKTALGVGTLASSQLHRVMATDGPENFIFEVLEEVPKDKLKERESYYIDFYDSKNYGLNTIRGEQK